MQPRAATPHDVIDIPYIDLGRLLCATSSRDRHFCDFSSFMLSIVERDACADSVTPTNRSQWGQTLQRTVVESAAVAASRDTCSRALRAASDNHTRLRHHSRHASRTVPAVLRTCPSLLIDLWHLIHGLRIARSIPPFLPPYRQMISYLLPVGQRPLSSQRPLRGRAHSSLRLQQRHGDGLCWHWQ